MRSIGMAALSALGIGAALATLALSSSAQDMRNPGEAAGSFPPGYLQRTSLPDSLALLPPPPAERSAALQADEEARERALALRDTPRWFLAGSDADLTFPHAAGTFSCAAGITISRESTPRLYGLLGKMLVDVGLSTYAAKLHYNRARPFVTHKTSTCLPAAEEPLRHDGSYPSGHSAVGWGWALVLAELKPERADAVLRRGREFGESRLVCGFHWQSDIEAGRLVAAAAVARLHADQGFVNDLAAAKLEIASSMPIPAQDARCVAEETALSAGH